MIGGEVPLFPMLVLGVAALVAIGAVLWAERSSAQQRSGMIKLDPITPDKPHACPLPWWRPFRRLGERVQCVKCGTTWRWDRYVWVPGDSSRKWINEQEEAEQAEIADRARRNAH